MGRSDKPFHAPFERIKQLVRESEIEPTGAAAGSVENQPPPSTEVHEETSEQSDEDLFRQEMAEVKRLAADDGIVTQRRPPPQPVRLDPEAEALAELDALVAGETTFDLRWSDEHVEGLARGVDRRLLRKLRKGGFSYSAHLDLHGYTRKEAKARVIDFLAQRRREGHRCVLIVHGRGLNSKDRIPVLKEALTGWLTRGRIARSVLAFCSALPSDGGLGAAYVLLRR